MTQGSYENNEQHHGQGADGGGNGSPAARVVWQVVASISSAAIVGIFFWLWNVTIDIREMQGMRSDLARIASDLGNGRAIIDRNSDRLTKIEAALEQSREIIKSIFGAMDGMRAEVVGARDTAMKHMAEDARLAEVVRQLQRAFEIHTQEANERPNYRPGPTPSHPE